MTNDEKPIVPPAGAEEIKNLDPEIQARDIKWRAKHKELAEENERLKLTSENEKKELLGKIDQSTKSQQDLQKKLVDAEIKSAAVAAGIKDIDFIKLIDTKSLIMKDDGTIEGLEKAVLDLKAAKPILFGEEKKTSSSKNATIPDTKKESKIDAFAMTDEEFSAQKAKLGLY